MSIGLHSKDIASKFSPLQQEIRKRTWFGCILIIPIQIKDHSRPRIISRTPRASIILTGCYRSLSMTFGRPCAIPEEYIRLDIPQPLPPCDSVPEEVQQLILAFYNASM
jgi:hypothetical protein